MSRATGTAAGTAVTAAVVMAFASGCGGGSDVHLATARTGHVQVGYPPDWRRQGGAGPFTAGKVEDGRTVAQLVVLERVVKATTAELAVLAMQAGRWNMKDFRRGRVQDARVKGARDARRIAYTYTSVDGGAARPAAGTDLVALIDRDVYVVRITWVKGKLPERDLAAMLKSVELKGGAQGPSSG